MFEGIMCWSIYKSITVTAVLLTYIYGSNGQLAMDDFDHPYQFDMIMNRQHNNLVNQEPIQAPNMQINADLNIEEVVVVPRAVYQNNPKPINDVYGTNSFITNRYPTGCPYGPKLKPIDHGAWAEWFASRPYKKSISMFDYTLWQAKFDSMKNYLITPNEVSSAANYFLYQSNKAIYFINDTLSPTVSSLSTSSLSASTLFIVFLTLIPGFAGFMILLFKTSATVTAHVTQCTSYSFPDSIKDSSITKWVSWVNQKSGALTWNCVKFVKLRWY